MVLVPKLAAVTQQFYLKQLASKLEYLLDSLCAEDNVMEGLVTMSYNLFVAERGL